MTSLPASVSRPVTAPAADESLTRARALVRAINAQRQPPPPTAFAASAPLPAPRALSHIARPFTAAARHPDSVSHASRETRYRSGACGVALTTRADGGTVVCYPDGRMAVCTSVTQSRDTVAMTSYVYDRDAAHTLLGAIDARGFGSLQESSGAARRPCFAHGGACTCAQFHADTSARLFCAACGHAAATHETGRVLSIGPSGLTLADRRGARAEPAKAGAPFPLPFEMRLNANLVVRVSRTGHPCVEFSCDGVQHACDLRLRSARPPKEAFRTSSQPTRSLSASASSPKLTTPNGVANANAEPDATLSSLLGSLSQLQSRILQTLNVTHDARVPTKLFGTRLASLPTAFGRESSFDSSLTGLKYDAEFVSRHPPLKRGAAIRSASGKYSLSQTVPPNTLKQRPLRALTNATYDTTIASEDLRGKCVFVFSCAAYIPACERLEKVLEQVHAELEEDGPYAIFKFDLSHSRLLVERHNLRFGPAVLAYFNGALVLAEQLGGGALLHRRRVPMVVLLEEEWSVQARIEGALRQATANGSGKPWQSVLAPSVDDLARQLADVPSARYEAIVLDLDKHDATEIETAHRLLARRLRDASDAHTSPIIAPPQDLFVIGISERDQTAAAGNLSFTLGALIRKPLNTRDILKALDKAYSLVAPPAGHTGVSKVDLLNLLHASRQLGLQGRALPTPFRFTVDLVKAVTDAPARIAAQGAISHTRIDTTPAWTPPPPPPPPPEPEPQPTKLDRKAAKKAKKK